MVNQLSLSNFNHLIERPDCTLGYNARTGAFLLLNDESCAALRAVRPLDSLSEPTREVLLESGFVVDQAELELIANKLRSEQKPSLYTHLVFTTTLACNFKCSYCFQNEYRENQKISETILRRGGEYLLKVLRETSAGLKVTWFGGEPLLALNRILYFMTWFKEIDASERKRVTFDIITNGLLLTDKVVDQLLECEIRRVQVTIDSLHYLGGFKRGALQPDGSLSPILSNAVAARAKGMQLSVRVNLDRRNVLELTAINRALSECGLKDVSYLARVEDDKSEFGSSTETSPCTKPHTHPVMPRRDYALQEKDQIFNRISFDTLLRRLRPRTYFCGATDGSMAVIAPDGLVSRCWNSAGKNDEAICNVLDADAFDRMKRGSNAEKWDDFSALNFESCRSCRVLPLCMGGCSHARVSTGTVDPPCTPVKFYIDELVQYVGSRLNVSRNIP